MSASLGITTASRVYIDNAAVSSTEAVRKGEFDNAMSGVSSSGHTHTVASISDFNSGWYNAFGIKVGDSDSLEWVEDAGQRKGNVRVKLDGGLLCDVSGLYADVGPSGTQLAAGNHTHAQLHDAVTVRDGATVNLSLDNQEVSAEVICLSGGGLQATESGVSADFGTGHSQVARGDHTHSGVGHEPASGANSSTVNLSVDALTQVATASVRLSSGGSGKGVLAADGEGLYFEIGPSGTQAAAGNHGHSVATEYADGFISSGDKRKLNQFTQLVQADYPVLYHRTDVCPEGEYVGGRYRWTQSMEVVGVNVVSSAPGATVLLGLEVGGSVVETVTIPGGTAGTEVLNYKALSGVFIEADVYARWVTISGVGVIEQEAAQVNLAMQVRSALDTAPTVRINCGGTLDTGFADDVYYDSGEEYPNPAASVDVTGVTNPAPQSVYLSGRLVNASVVPLNYEVPGLAKGLNYTVRLHFASPWAQTGIIKFTIRVIGKTTEEEANFDISVATSGVANKAVVKEYTVKPGNDGKITVQLVPQVGSVSHLPYALINGIELLPVL